MTYSIDPTLELIRARSGQSCEAIRAFETISNSAWLVRFDGEEAVLRQHTLSFGAPVTNHQRELDIHALAVAHGLSPEILFADIEAGLLLTRFEPAGAFSADALKRKVGLESVAHALAALHRIELPETLAGYSLAEAADCYWRRAGSPSQTALLDCVATVHRNEQIHVNAAPVLCHRDVLHSNVLATTPVQFIDWEFASPGERWFDLAALICWHELDARQRDILLIAYWGKLLQPREQQALQRAIASFRALCTLWSLPAVA